MPRAVEHQCCCVQAGHSIPAAPTRASPERLRTPEQRNPRLADRVTGSQQPWPAPPPLHAAHTATLPDTPECRPRPPQPYRSPLVIAGAAHDNAGLSRGRGGHAGSPGGNSAPQGALLAELGSRLARVESELAACMAGLNSTRDSAVQVCPAWFSMHGC